MSLDIPRASPLRGLALRDGEQPRRGTAGCEGCRVLPHLPQERVRKWVFERLKAPSWVLGACTLRVAVGGSHRLRCCLR
jgi:hypothetical protein